MPGAEQAPDNQAPEALDHFKRGYAERASLRDREVGDFSAEWGGPTEEDQDRDPLKLLPLPTLSADQDATSCSNWTVLERRLQQTLPLANLLPPFYLSSHADATFMWLFKSGTGWILRVSRRTSITTTL